MFRGIDLYSDTVTRPTLAMRQAMAEAEVGDEQLGEDPTTTRLEEKLAAWCGKPAATFFPTATMANEVAIALHCQRGDELIAAANCHLFIAEAGGPAVLGGVMIKPLPTATGIFSGDALREAQTWEPGPHDCHSRLVSVENTANMSGGVAWSQDQLNDVSKTAHELGMKTHMDGARLFHAVVATRRTVKEVTQGFDSVTICLSKGLGCPTGAILLHDKDSAAPVRKWKQRFGGALRQSGILAAAGLYALENHVARLEEDHRKASQLATLLTQISGVSVENPVPSTNMVFFSLNHTSVSPAEFNLRVQQAGLRFSQVGKNRFRAVTHLDVSLEQMDQAAKIVEAVVTGRK